MLLRPCKTLRANHRAVCHNEQHDISRIAIELMASESQIPIDAQAASKRFATRLALFYGTLFGLVGTHLPFFPVWLKAVGIEPGWIGVITAVPAVTRFTALPFVTSLAERRQSLRGALIVTAFGCAIGFLIVGSQQQALAVFLAFAFTFAMWAPMTPLTSAYALRGVARYGLNYGPLRLGGPWVLGVLAEIVLFALSPRFTLPPSVLVVIAALCAVARWVITAQAPPIEVLAVVQLAHGLTFGLTMVGTMGLLAHHVPGHVMARGQGYLAACTGIVSSCASIASGALYARYGEGVYYMMAAMAATGALTMWLARHRLSPQPQSAASGG